jgi:GAF domain-containing protein
LISSGWEATVDAQKKRESYDEILERLERCFGETTDRIARMAQAAALLFKYFDDYFWTGFYQLVDGKLTVGPYQGSPTATVLAEHQGVCWACIDRGELVNVPNVHEFAGHIRVEGPSNSEISVPLFDESGEVYGLLHVDAADYDAFDEIDEQYLARIGRMF